MDKYDLKDLLRYVAREMGDYTNFRSGGNFGTSIQGYLNLKASENIERGLSSIANEIKNLSQEIAKFSPPLVDKEVHEGLPTQ